ncbi:MAG: DUF4157 domain-containing protein [Candidatus Methanoperedens sp.]
MSEKAKLAVKAPEAKRENNSPQIKRNHSQSRNSPVDQILLLQRTIGNQAVQRLIKSGALQAKLKIGLPGDKYEQEADRVADQVMRMPEPQVPKGAAVSGQIADNPIQRRCPRCIKEPDSKILREENLQTKEVQGQTPETTPEIENSIGAIRGSGQPLPESVRAFYEPRFGRDFSGVRVHTDAKATESAQAVNARAFTVGRDVVFGIGQYTPGTREGRRLLAHELTHVMQQKESSGTILELGRTKYEYGIKPQLVNIKANNRNSFQTSHLPSGLLVQRANVPEESRARELSARADLEAEGWTVLSDDDVVTRRILRIPENEPAADLLARKGARSWLIADSKGRDPSSFVAKQGPNTNKYLKKLHPDSRVSFRAYVKPTANQNDLGSGLSAPSGFLIKKQALGEARPGVESKLEERMVRIEENAVQVRGGKLPTPTTIPPVKTPPKAAPTPFTPTAPAPQAPAPITAAEPHKATASPTAKPSVAESAIKPAAPGRGQSPPEIQGPTMSKGAQGAKAGFELGAQVLGAIGDLLNELQNAAKLQAELERNLPEIIKLQNSKPDRGVLVVVRTEVQTRTIGYPNEARPGRYFVNLYPISGGRTQGEAVARHLSAPGIDVMREPGVYVTEKFIWFPPRQ